MSAVVKSNNGVSRIASDLLVGKGLIRAISPRIKPKLKMLDPTTLEREISESPLNAAVAVTRNSGAEVPKATIVRPITRSETLYFFAIFEADSTIQSAPNHNRKILSTRKMY